MPQVYITAPAVEKDMVAAYRSLLALTAMSALGCAEPLALPEKCVKDEEQRVFVYEENNLPAGCLAQNALQVSIEEVQFTIPAEYQEIAEQFFTFLTADFSQERLQRLRLEEVTYYDPWSPLCLTHYVVQGEGFKELNYMRRNHGFTNSLNYILLNDSSNFFKLEGETQRIPFS